MTVNVNLAPGGSTRFTIPNTGDSTSNGTATFEGNSATEFSSTQVTTINGQTISSSAKSYSILDGTDLVTYGSTAQATVSGFNSSSKIVFSPPYRDKRFSLAVGASDSETYTLTSTTTITGAPVALPPQVATSTQTQVVTYLGRESVTVGAGTFDTCKFDVNNGASTQWFATRGAMVKSSSTSNAGTTVLSLSSGNTNGVAIKP
jgi:hypothetical protein